VTDAEFHAHAERILSAVELTIDRWLQDDVIDIDVHRTGGLLELTLPDQSKLILNTQPPLHELWLAARSGGFHFRHDGVHWLDRQGQELLARLSACASAQAGRSLHFTLA
jgi:CyaY protein